MPMTAQNLVKGNYGYLYCHMSDKGEWTAYAISRDGYNYQDINSGNPIFNPEEHARIEGGTRKFVYVIEPNDNLLKCMKSAAPRKVMIEQNITAKN